MGTMSIVFLVLLMMMQIYTSASPTKGWRFARPDEFTTNFHYYPANDDSTSDSSSQTQRFSDVLRVISAPRPRSDAHATRSRRNGRPPRPELLHRKHHQHHGHSQSLPQPSNSAGNIPSKLSPFAKEFQYSTDATATDSSILPEKDPKLPSVQPDPLPQIITIMPVGNEHFATSTGDFFGPFGCANRLDRFHGDLRSSGVSLDKRIPPQLMAYASIRFFVGLNSGMAAMLDKYHYKFTGVMEWLPPSNATYLHAVRILFEENLKESFLCIMTQHEFACYLIDRDGLLRSEDAVGRVIDLQYYGNSGVSSLTSQIIFDMTMTAFSYWHFLAEQVFAGGN
jgi:hypothetical protein